MKAIWWIRRDLRLNDNLTLQKALSNSQILPVFILDPILLSGTNTRRLSFLFNNLAQFDNDLRIRGSYLVLRNGSPVDELEKLLAETGAEQIVAEEDFTPYDRLRSVLVGSRIPLKTVQGQLGLHPLANLKANGKPYQVFTSFKKNWLALLPDLSSYPAPAHIPTIPDISSDPIPEGDPEDLFPPGETAAWIRLADFLSTKSIQYSSYRDRMDLEGTSLLSPYFHFGILGLRTAIFKILQVIRQTGDAGEGQSAETWLNELIWREFYIHILYHY
ncbi:MAG: deoxyribodipyrimidine photo-lyase, partial [Anaerolineales bacterium]|nr:deoxyribodipyrimidine photo-lyase [Anaerolineales bacterium]